MNEHLFLCIHAVNQGNTGSSQLLAFESANQADAYMRNWLICSCGLDPYCGEKEEAALRAENGGKLPELAFACPKVSTPSDLEHYNGFHYFAAGGSIQLFVMVIYDEKSAFRFRQEITREFELDKIFSDEADQMIDMLQCLERSFADSIDYQVALERVNRLLQQGGLNLF